MIFKKNLIIAAVVFLVIVALVIFYFDKALFLGLLFVGLLTTATLWIVYKLKIGGKDLKILFLIAFLIHLGVVLFIYYANFKPFGEGDFVIYQQIAEQISSRIHAGNFSLEGINYLHYYPVIIGWIYAITMPVMIVGQLFSAWLAALAVLLAYLIVVEMGGSKKSAFLVGLIICVYPSFIYFGSLLLKDTVIIPLVLLGLLLSIKILKNFDVLKFVAFFIVLTFAIHLRFYIGFALMFSFIFCWFLISNLKIKERLIYGLTFIFIFGFSPLLLGYGYYGSVPLIEYLNRETITTYREVVYAPSPEFCDSIKRKNCCAATEEFGSGVGSSFVVKAGFESNTSFIKNYTESFVYAFFGPFPWQLKYKRHLFFLAETMPWYFLICLIVCSIYKSFKTLGYSKTFNHYKFTILLLAFSAMALGALSLFINNFGIIVRIRMPVFIVIFCLIGLDKNVDNIVNKAINYFYEKKFNKFFGLPSL